LICNVTHLYVFRDMSNPTMRHISSFLSRTPHILVTNAAQVRPTQSIIYVPLQVNRFQKTILLIVQYKYLKSCSGDFILQNLILRTRLFGTMFITQPSCVFHFRLTEICQAEMICIGGVPVLKRHFGGAGPQIFYMIHRGGRISCILRSCLCVT